DCTGQTARIEGRMPVSRAFAAALLLMAPTPAVAQAPQTATADVQLEQRAADIVAVLKQERSAGDAFSDQFMAAVPEAQLNTLIAQIEGQFGPLQGVESVTPAGPPGAADIALRFERSIASGQFQLDAAPTHKVA